MADTQDLQEQYAQAHGEERERMERKLFARGWKLVRVRKNGTYHEAVWVPGEKDLEEIRRRARAGGMELDVQTRPARKINNYNKRRTLEELIRTDMRPTGGNANDVLRAETKRTSHATRRRAREDDNIPSDPQELIRELRKHYDDEQIMEWLSHEEAEVT